MCLACLVKDLTCYLDRSILCLNLQWGFFVVCDLKVNAGLDYLFSLFYVVYDLEAKFVVGKEQVPVQKFVDGLVTEAQRQLVVHNRLVFSRWLELNFRDVD